MAEDCLRSRRIRLRDCALPLALLLTGCAVSTCGAASPFAIRGIKGLCWDGVEKYQKALPWLAEHNLNFLMICYTSFPQNASAWRSDYTPEQKQGVAKLAAQAKRLRVNLCLAINPAIYSKPPLTYSSEQDYQLLWNKVCAVHGLGVGWFALCLDDISRELEPADKERFGTLQASQVYFVNRLWRDMRSLKPRCKLIFCPSAYLTDDAAAHLDYIQAVGAGIDPGVMMFWTGPQCCSASITAQDARVFGKWIRRKPFVWDNYPVNDMYGWRPLIGPLKNRSADLASAVSGYLANPMMQWYASTIPLSTTAAYLNDPAGYNPAKEVEATIRSFPEDQRRAIRLLAELYGSAFWGEPGFPPQPRPADRRAAEKLLPKYRTLQKELSSNPGLSNLWDDVREGVEEDIRFLERRAGDRLAISPLQADGDEFEGGAGSVFGFGLYGRRVNYVYAKSTSRNEMRVEFRVESVPASGAKLRVLARHAASFAAPVLRIMMNGAVVHDGPSPFSEANFSEKSFDLPASVLREGPNVLTVENAEPTGPLGMPPWIMVAEAEIIPR